MHVDIVDTMFEFTQNIGSNEDIVTGALATALYYCPQYTRMLFDELNINYPFNKKYYVNSGWQFSSDYKWLKKSINFRPDIMLSLYEEDWNYEKNKPPENESLILVEAKFFGSKFGRDQEKCYREFKSEFSRLNTCNVKMLLISIEDYSHKENSSLFDRVIKWQNLLDISENIYQNKIDDFESERIILGELIEFMKLQILPLKEDLFYEGKLCPKKVLAHLKDIIRSEDLKVKNQRIFLKETKPLSEYYEDEYEMDKVLNSKFNSMKITQNTPISYFKLYGQKNEEFYLNCAIVKNIAALWIDFEEDNSIKTLGQLNFAKRNWRSDWFETTNAAFDEIHNLIL